MSLKNSFPGLASSNFSVTSPASIIYNCIAWAAGDDADWWWPAEDAYWPTTDCIATVEAFVRAFATLGYLTCDDGLCEEGFERIALYVKDDRVTHAARQLANGRWTSKLGQDVDIEHELLAIEGTIYGKVMQFLRRPIPTPQTKK